jgi:negative regulator of sigma E activity
MNTLDDNICEQLSAWMDGELSREEAKFLERRLQHDEALQTMYARLQMASASMKGHSARLMPNTLCDNVRQALADESASPSKSRKPLFAWAAAASMAFAALLFVPGMMNNKAQNTQPTFAASSQSVSPTDTTPTFASADLIANTPDAVSTSIVASSATATKVNATNPAVIETASSVVSPETFPLNISSAKKTWPRSAVNANSDPALEAYLVRHNQMMAQDGMGGFVPYVDVVAQDAGQPGQETSEAGIEKEGDTK